MSDSKATQSYSHAKDARKGRRLNAHMVQNVLLIWLDANINEHTSSWQNNISRFRRVVSTIKAFTDGHECLQFLEDIADEKVCMIISGSLGQQMVPRVHKLSQVDSILIFCGNKKYHQVWADDWSKIKGVFTEIGPMCEALKQVSQECEQNAISISIMDGGQSGMEKSGNRVDPSFMYTQIMKEILVTIKFEQKHIDEFIEYCRVRLTDNKDQLKYVDQLARQYRQQTPIWWYSCECFLNPMLNRALRLMDVDLMTKMGFFIGDLHRHIAQLHQEQFPDDSSKQRFTVYRGQGMNKEVFKKMTSNKGGLMSFNNFLFTSKNRSTSLGFAQRALANDQMVGVLFVMNIDPARSSTPFVSVIDVGQFGKQEGELLSPMHTVYRIGEITPVGGNARLVQVQLNLVDEQDNDLHDLVDYIRRETFPHLNGWQRLGLLLWKMDEFAKAEEVCQTLLKQATEDIAKAPIYVQLGTMKAQQEEYAQAAAYYQKSIEIEEQQIPHTDQNLVSSYNSIGNVYFKMGDNPEALSSYEKALTISRKSLPPIDPHVADSYSGIGLIYDTMGDQSKALWSHEKALTIRQQSLPPTHPDLASSYNNIGLLHSKMGDHPKALSSHEKALAIRQKSLPPTHPDLAASYSNICSVYNSVSDYSKALSFHEKALAIHQQSLPPTHPTLAMSYDTIGLLHDNMGNYSKAHSCFQLAVDIAQRSLPANDSNLQRYRNNLARMKKKL